MYWKGPVSLQRIRLYKCLDYTRCHHIYILAMALVQSTVTVCYTEKAEQAQQHPGTKATINPAEDNRKEQCRPNVVTVCQSVSGTVAPHVC